MSQLEQAAREALNAWRELEEAFNAGRSSALAQQEKPEPVAYIVYMPNVDRQELRFEDELGGDLDGCEITELYTQPPRREWVGLTYRQREDMAHSFLPPDFISQGEYEAYMRGSRDTEAKLKELNK